jgi:predicted nucleic acid-binding Zn ribbon protein
MLTLVLVYGTPTKRKTTNMLFLQSRSKENYSRQKRSCTSDCATASGVIDSSSFSQCVTKFNQILDPDAQPLTISDGQNFCSGHCDTNTVKALDDIEACCGEDPFPKTFVEIFQDSCKTTPRGQLCISVYQNISFMFIKPESAKSQQFINCGATYQGDTTQCPSECNDILSYITDTIGCCYKSVSDEFQEGPASLVPDALFTVCNKTPPTRCTS